MLWTRVIVLLSDRHHGLQVGWPTSTYIHAVKPTASYTVLQKCLSLLPSNPLCISVVLDNSCLVKIRGFSFPMGEIKIFLMELKCSFARDKDENGKTERRMVRRSFAHPFPCAPQLFRQLCNWVKAGILPANCDRSKSNLTWAFTILIYLWTHYNQFDGRSYFISHPFIDSNSLRFSSHWHVILFIPSDIFPNIFEVVNDHAWSIAWFADISRQHHFNGLLELLYTVVRSLVYIKLMYDGGETGNKLQYWVITITV